MLNKFLRYILYLTSNLPLFLVLFIQYVDIETRLDRQPLLLTLLIMMVLLVVLLIGILIKIKKQKYLVKQIELSNIKPMKEMSLTYIFSNILPLVAFDFSNKQQLISFLVIFFILMFLYVKYNLITYNPVLELLGYTNYIAKMGEKDIYDISKSKFIHSYSISKVKVIWLDSEVILVTEILE